MNKTFLIIPIALFCALLLCSCEENHEEKNQEEIIREFKKEKGKLISEEEKKANNADFAKQSVDDELAKKISHYINTEYLTEGDVRAIKEEQRKFQLHKIDLNKDGNEEVFVNFMTTYFCGSGGCTVLLLDSNLELITKFSPTQVLYVEEEMQNGWRILITRAEGDWRKLVYQEETYPSNPTIVETISEAPNPLSTIMFDEFYEKSKIYNF